MLSRPRLVLFHAVVAMTVSACGESPKPPPTEEWCREFVMHLGASFGRAKSLASDNLDQRRSARDDIREHVSFTLVQLGAKVCSHSSGDHASPHGRRVSRAVDQAHVIHSLLIDSQFPDEPLPAAGVEKLQSQLDALLEIFSGVVAL